MKYVARIAATPRLHWHSLIDFKNTSKANTPKLCNTWCKTICNIVTNQIFFNLTLSSTSTVFCASQRSSRPPPQSQRRTPIRHSGCQSGLANTHPSSSTSSHFRYSCPVLPFVFVFFFSRMTQMILSYCIIYVRLLFSFRCESATPCREWLSYAALTNIFSGSYSIHAIT